VSELLFLEPVGGIAGDMFLAAALDCGLPLDELARALATLQVNFRLEATRAEAAGLAGTHVEVVVEGPQPECRALAEIRSLIEASGLSPRAKKVAVSLFERIGRAEAKVHGVPVERVHFHEVGAVDSIVDVCGAAVALDLFGWPRVVSLPPELGHGFVKTAHGRLPVPGPAVLELLKGVMVRLGGPPGEAVTPTGAALLAGLCEVGAPPPFVPRTIGYGIGTSRWPDRPNALRMSLGEIRDLPPDSSRLDGERATLWELACNLDDCSGQLVARAIEAALAAGALDAWAAPCTMKKGRPGLVLAALAAPERRAEVERIFFAETTTLGVRARPVERRELSREIVSVDTPYGCVRIKVGRLCGEVIAALPEYEDCAALSRARGAPVKEVMAAAMASFRSG